MTTMDRFISLGVSECNPLLNSSDRKIVNGNKSCRDSSRPGGTSIDYRSPTLSYRSEAQQQDVLKEITQ